MWSDKERKAIRNFEEAAERAGGYVDYVPGRSSIIDADYRAMIKYCKEKGINSMDLTEEEFAIFAYDIPPVYGETVQ
jgi:hypothetical protein